MKTIPASIEQQPQLKPAEDFYRLRREGIGFIEQMSSPLWNDYNSHDPGITLLEALCYAITDLAYRIDWNIEDILMSPKPSSEPDEPYPQQAFFTARNILTVNATTPDDLRRLLIDQPEIRNAWVFPKSCACDVHYYAWCDKDRLTLSYQEPAADIPAQKVSPQGLYEVLLELEADCDAQIAIKHAKTTLLAQRNLDEDVCSIQVVGVENVAVCADVEIAPDTDIEWLQARIWFEIEQYFTPSIPFYSAAELLDAGMSVEEIFNGPKLDHGFIKSADLQAAVLKSVLRSSDIINRLMDIDGVIAVKQLLLTKYDANGNLVQGAADNGPPYYDTNKISASWTMAMRKQHQARLYLAASRCLFYKNGLPFRPRMQEALDTLTQLRGTAERPKNALAAKDLPIPRGVFRDPEDYYPLQYSLPTTYGVGPQGLPPQASEQRKAQARQLQAYLLVFEQILANALAQLAHTAELFSLDPEVKRSYFVKEINAELIKGIEALDKGLTKAAVEQLSETPSEFLLRRNRFLDHLLARFAEPFSDYAALLSGSEGKKLALDRLIADKIAFLKAYPAISYARAKAFDYRQPATADNVSGIQQRVRLLLGNPDLPFIVVEHLLLRPKFLGDALYPVCAEGECHVCGDEDPYSFRLSFIMPASNGAYADDLAMRRYAERTIRQELPAHLIGKICWLGSDSFERFAKAWDLWLKANAQIDWLEERLHEGLQAQLKAAYKSPLTEAELCQRATTMLRRYGLAFYQWMEKNWAQGVPFEAFTLFSLSAEPGTDAAIHEWLLKRYNAYREVSCRLWVLVNLLSELRNVYPTATLHDFDEGNDQNPVRLGSTALGNSPPPSPTV